MGFFAVRFDASGNPEVIDGTPELGLERTIAPSDAKHRPDFRITRPFGYAHGPKETAGLEIVVPARLGDVETDLASVPAWLGWLMAKTGRNLPAAVLHDVLVVSSQDNVSHWYRAAGDSEFTRATRAYEPADRWRADWMFRDAMGDVGVDRVRRWIVWAGVAIGTLWRDRPKGPRGWSQAARVALLVALLLAAVALLPFTLVSLADGLWDVPLLGDGNVFAKLGGAGLYLAALTASASLVSGVGSRDKHRWGMGLMVIPVALLGWAFAVSLLVYVVFMFIRQLGSGAMREPYIGSVINYYRKVGVAVVRIEGGSLNTGDTISIRGHTTDLTYQTVDSMEIDHQRVESVVSGQEVGIRVVKRVRKKDKVYRRVPV